MRYTKNKQQEVSDEAKGNESMAGGTQNSSIKGNDTKAESETGRILPLLWSDQVSLLCGKDAVYMAEPQKP